MPENDEALEEIMLETEERMQKSQDAFKRAINNIRSSRANPSMVENLQVEYYGAMTPLSQMAGIAVPEPRMLMLTPFDRSALGDIEKAILKSDLSLTPNNDGTVIRLVLPELTMDRRQELVKQLKGKLEDAKVSIRNVRRDGNEHIKKLKDKGFSEDAIKSGQDDSQKLTDKFVANVEKMSGEKEKDILTV